MAAMWCAPGRGPAAREAGRRPLLLLWLASLARHAHAQNWHLVDVPAIVCDDGPGQVDIDMSLEGTVYPDRPHVFTFYRSSSKLVDVKYSAVDGGRNEVLREDSVQLQSLQFMSRRLGTGGGTGAPGGAAATASSEPAPLRGGGGGGPGPGSWGGAATPGGRDDGNEGFLAMTRLAACLRLLRARPFQRAGSNVGTASSNRGPLESLLSSGRSQRRPRAGVDDSRFSNPSNPGAGHYGYTSQAALNRGFPGGYTQTSYGYSGATAYRASAGSKIALAAGGAAVAGAGAAYVASRWNTHGVQASGFLDSCYYGAFIGSCRVCFEYYDSYRCVNSYSPPEDMARDDVMKTGFIPSQSSDPLRVSIHSVIGDDFHKDRICPPPGWHWNRSLSAVSWQPPGHQDLFITITPVEPLSEDDEEDDLFMMGGAMVFALGMSLSCFACFLRGVAKPKPAGPARGIELHGATAAAAGAPPGGRGAGGSLDDDASGATPVPEAATMATATPATAAPLV